MLSLNEFLGTQTNVASERLKLIPKNDAGYLAQIVPDGIGLADFIYKKGERQGQTGYRMTVKWQIEDAELAKTLQRTPTVVQSITLNLNEDGSLAAENPGLRGLREAVNQNKDGQPWQPAMLIGQVARIFVDHRIDDQGQEQHEIKKVVKV